MSTVRSFGAAATRWAPFLAPMLYLALVFSLQPADRLGPPEAHPGVGRLIYDDYDVTAFALRGLNAARGRAAGRLSDPCREPVTAVEASASGPPAQYYLEYPHAALLLFRIPYWWPPPVTGSALISSVANACHNAIVEHHPENAAQRAVWRKLRQASRVYITIGLTCLLALMLVTRIGYQSGSRLAGPVLLLLLPATMYFSANRLDIMPTLLVALSLTCLGRGQLAGFGVLLGVATMVKVYPVLVAPLVIRYLMVNRRRAFQWLSAYGLAMLAIATWTIAAYGWDAAVAPYRVQFGRTLDVFTFFGAVLPAALGGNSSGPRMVRAVAVLLVLALLGWGRPTELAGVLRRSAIVLIVFVSLQVFYSPQWVVWLTPFLTPLAGERRSVLWLTIAWDFVTYLTFPIAFDLHPAASVIAALIDTRAVVMGALVATLAWAEFRASLSGVPQGVLAPAPPPAKDRGQ